MEKTQRGECELSKLIPAPYNPRKISDEQMNGLQASLDRWGLVQDIVVNKKTRHIVGGHQRVNALKVNGIKKAPVVWVDIDEDEEKALNIALNSSFISGEFDYDKLPALLDEVHERLPEVYDDLRFDEMKEEIFKSSNGVELDVDSFDDIMELKFSLRSSLYHEVTKTLMEVDDDKNRALLLCLGVKDV